MVARDLRKAAPVPRAMEMPESPIEESWQKAMLAQVSAIADIVKRVSGQSPQFKPYEFDLIAGGRETLKAPFRPQRWVVWSRTPVATTDTLRMDMSTDAGKVAVEVYGGKLAVMPGRETISFHNPSPNTLHIFAVASGSDDFIVAVP